jgi:hypothetical protein
MRWWKLGLVTALGAALTASTRRARPPAAARVPRRRSDWSRVDEAGADSLPASDPPSWTLGDDAADRR